MIKLNVATYGKKDAIGFLPADLIANLPAFTGRKDRTEEAINAMVESLLTEGQIEDVVYRISFDRKPILVTGVTRALAADRINKQKLTDPNGNTYSDKNPFILTGRCKNVNDLDALFLTYRENAGDTRTPMTELDEAEFCNVLSENYGLSDAETGKKLRKPAQWVANRKKILVLDKATQEKLTSGQIDFNTALTATEIAPEDRPAAFAAAATTAKGKVTAAALTAAAEATGAKTGKTLKRTEKMVNEWMKDKINSTEGPVSDLLSALMHYRKGTVSVEDLDNAFFAAVTPATKTAAN
jgi:hypothetical protein